MFGSKLRSWMEAVRPRKKQNRKDKQNKKNENATQNVASKKKESTLGNITKFTKKIESELSSNGPLKPEPSTSRYSVANLSSPESAYSTGYSTDGTSPGAPPEYYAEVKSSKIETKPLKHQQKQQCDNNPSIQTNQKQNFSPILENTRPIIKTLTVSRQVEVSSPRQRNRIRTNPWLTTCTNNNNATKWNNSYIQDSPDPRFFTSSSQCVASASPRSRRKSTPSSSCSSLSGDVETYWEGSEDDCTLNEMMGKYDESYVYEKETDILSDSEPNDLDTDIDTGQDGGDELEPQEGDMYFIDDGSYTETNPAGENKNTGHCSYFNFQEKRKASRRKTTRKSRHKSSKKRTPPPPQFQLPEKFQQFKSDGSRSVGATPLFARRTRQLPISKLAIEQKLSKRSNSAHLYHSNLNSIDKRDEEAEQKYEELIVEAEHILRNIKTEGLSPRRLPGPANKRVELLRSAECPKAARVGDVPSTNITSLRFRSGGIPPNTSPVLPSVLPMPRSPLMFKKPLADRQNHHRSPKHKRKSSRVKREIITSSSEDERPKFRALPQSEPVKRKVYATNKYVVIPQNNCSNVLPQRHRNSAESLRHQVLINTIANLKKSLEDQSASLKQAYRSPQHCPPCL